ncbi:MAG TPA: glycosyltransferase family 4 protein [Ktedonobacterales bacterium]|nr:glycosyltransferase family 4 protein [Ktedonobacterales bacterium]
MPVGNASLTQRIGFVIEQQLGHGTHSRNLERYIQDDQEVTPVWMPLDFEATGWLKTLPLVRSNWSVRASLLARRAIGRASQQGKLDALFIHTQVASLAAGRAMRATPTIISLDATPINYDAVGEFYGHKSGGPLEGVKFRANVRAFSLATGLVTWCRWAKDSLVHDYGVPPEKITVIPPGVDLSLWPKRPSQGTHDPSKPIKLLFVGGDFKRKGGEVLLECFQRYFQKRCELHLVTQEPVPQRLNLYVYNGVKPKSETLTRLFAEADLFVFPTLADCAPVAVTEALAASLPVISTRVGAIPESVQDGKTGRLVDAGNVEQLRQALDWLIDHPEQRLEMGQLGRRLVEADYDAEKNCRRLLEILKAAARQTQSGKG